MKRILLAIIATFASLSLFADDENGLYIVTSETSTYAVSQLKKITFSNGNVVVEKTDGTSTTTPMASISRMYFGALSTAIQDVNMDGNNFDGKNIIMATSGRVRIFRASGQMVSDGNYEPGQAVSIENLPTGVYVVEIGGKSFKVAK